uniref:Jumonji domain-containing protein 4 n=1 Tax=Strigamia maritima TaxID=126957 RepID=T1J5J7_STRMM
MATRINLFDISNHDFYNEFLLKNKPCLIEEDVTTNWCCRQLWVTKDGKPNLSYLKTHFGSSVAPVANCKIKHYNAQLTNNITVNDFVDYWQQYIDSDYSDSIECRYLKDWHFQKEHPDYYAYSVPKFFTFDWLNEYCKSKTDDDYDFVYMGPKGSWTPFHADVFRSHSWSANVCGKKRWLLCPPGTEKKLTDSLGNLPYDLEEVKTQIPGLIDVLQGPGEIIFVPSNWHHQVYNLARIEDTISINRNWFNGSNIDEVYNFLIKSLDEVRCEINDCKDMDGWDKQCQVILKVSQGMDFYDFYDLLKFVAHSRLTVCNEEDSDLNKFELFKLRETLKQFLLVENLPDDLLSSIRSFQSFLNGKKE